MCTYALKTVEISTQTIWKLLNMGSAIDIECNRVSSRG